MAEITRSIGDNEVPLTSLTPTPENSISGGLAGENLLPGQAVYLHTDGRFYLATGAAVNAAARVVGFVGKRASAGEAVTVYRNVRMSYGTGLTPGAQLFLSGTVAGGLADAASTGGTVRLAIVLSDGKRIQIGGLI